MGDDKISFTHVFGFSGIVHYTRSDNFTSLPFGYHSVSSLHASKFSMYVFFLSRYFFKIKIMPHKKIKDPCFSLRFAHCASLALE